MNLALKALRKAVQTPTRLIEYFELRRKRECCMAGSGVSLHPYCRIENCQEDPNVISIGAFSVIVGHLQVPANGGSIWIGEYCYVGENSRISSAGSITIGNRVLISHNVNIHDHNAHSTSAQARHLHFKGIISTGHPKNLEDVTSAPIV